MTHSLLTIPFPPSVNRLWRNVKGRTLLSKEGRDYRQRVAECVLLAGIPRLGHRKLRVVIKAHAPDARRRDIDNLNKAALDALQKAHVYADDWQIDDLRIYRAEIDRENPRLIVWIEAHG